jgi:UDP-N-acetyl-D-mannosaminuronate dehydrogenase
LKRIRIVIFPLDSFLARGRLKISVFGLGYVVTVSAGCLAHQGHEVIGVGPIRTKIDLINSGQLPIVEADIGEILSAVMSRGNLSVTDDSTDAILLGGPHSLRPDQVPVDLVRIIDHRSDNGNYEDIFW